MGSILSACNDEDKAAYEAEHGQRDRDADYLLQWLRSLPAALFRVEELMYVMDPWQGHPTHLAIPKSWDAPKFDRLKAIRQRLVDDPLDELPLEFTIRHVKGIGPVIMNRASLARIDISK